MKSEEALVGKRVRVKMDHGDPDLWGQEGTIVKRWGNPGYAALDVLLDEGGGELFWYHELEEVDDGGTRHRGGEATLPPSAEKVAPSWTPTPMPPTRRPRGSWTR